MNELECFTEDIKAFRPDTKQNTRQYTKTTYKDKIRVTVHLQRSARYEWRSNLIKWSGKQKILEPRFNRAEIWSTTQVLKCKCIKKLNAASPCLVLTPETLSRPSPRWHPNHIQNAFCFWFMLFSSLWTSSGILKWIIWHTKSQYTDLRTGMNEDPGSSVLNQPQPHDQLFRVFQNSAETQVLKFLIYSWCGSRRIV